MIDNYFDNSPTVGSHDNVVTIEELQAQIRFLEQKHAETEKILSKKKEKEKKASKKRWKKAEKFFTTFVKPVFDFVPKFLNGLANFFKAKAKYA